jgi:hypothetical protein
VSGGSVVEQGLRGELEPGITIDEEKGEFRRMLASQGKVPKAVPTDVDKN